MYGTITELKSRLRIPLANTNEDDTLTRMLSGATKTVELYTHRRFAVDTETTRLIDCTRDNVLGTILFLPDDIHTITAVVNGDGDTVLATEYVTEPRERSVDGNTVTALDWPFSEIQLTPTSRRVWTYQDDPLGAISITGYWGFSAEPSDDILEATYQLAMYVYRLPDKADRVAISPDGLWVTPNSMPAYVKDALRPYRRNV